MDTEQNNKKKSIIEKLPIENIKIFFAWLFVLAVLIGGIFAFVIIYNYGGMVKLLSLVFWTFLWSFAFFAFSPPRHKCNIRVLILVNILVFIAFACFLYFFTPTPEEIFSRTMEQINKNKQ